MEITATRRLQYAIGHRVYKHESKCRSLHGHNFVFFLTARMRLQDIEVTTHSDPQPRFIRGPQQDALGRVMDFGVLKDRFGGWLETFWDHGMLLWEHDEEAIAGVRLVPGSKLALLPDNPTAENMAKYLLLVVGPNVLRGTAVELIRVRIFETENGIAEVAL